MKDEHVVERADIESALKRLQGYVVKTPLLLSPQLSATVGVDVYLKCENLQRTGSFKLRGALNKLLSMQSQGGEVEVEGRTGVAAGGGVTGVTGVVTASSGNHGQAVAYAAQLLGLPCTVVVPETVLAVKEQAILGFGAKVIRCGVTSSERIDLATKLADEQQWVFIPPYDDSFIVAGQGTVGAEIAEQCPNVATVIVPIGGGGLIAGVSTAIKTMLPGAKVYGVEPRLANDTYLSRQAGYIVDIGETRTIADGLRTSHPGNFTFPIVQRHVDDILLVDEETIGVALRRLLMESKLLVEPSGCTSVAALLQNDVHPRIHAIVPGVVQESGPIVCVLSGGNVDWDTVKHLVS